MATNRLYRWMWAVFVVTVLLHPQLGRASDLEHVTSAPFCHVTFDPVVMENIPEGTHRSLLFNATCDWTHYTPFPKTTVTMEIWSTDSRYLAVDGATWYNLTSSDDVISGNLTLRGVGFGRMQVLWDVCVVEDPVAGLGHLGDTPADTVRSGTTPASVGRGWYLVCRPSAVFPVSVVSPSSALEIAFLVVLGVMIVIYNLGFGCALQPAHVVEIVKRPVGPAIGLVCQFVFMAPLSFGIAKLLALPTMSGLGLLAVGSAPGGGGSNVFTKLLDGDLELSITMSFISTLVSLGMTPLWIFALGRYFTEGGTKTVIPIQNVFTSLAVVTVPVIIGGIITRFKPKAGAKIAWGLKPFTAIIGVVFISMGVYLNLPALLRVDGRTLVAAGLVPLVGYSLGGGSAALFRQGRKKVITIALETGFQNFSLSLMLLSSSLESPDSELASVVPVVYTFLSAAIPAVVFLAKMAVRLYRWGRRRCRGRVGDGDSDGEVQGSYNLEDRQKEEVGLKVEGGGVGA